MSPSDRTRIKFCGMTSAREAALAGEAGADAVGVILASSPRYVDLSAAAAIAREVGQWLSLVAVVDADLSLVPRLCSIGFSIQFAAPVEPEIAWRATGGAPYLRVVHLDERESAPVEAEIAPGETPLFDTAARCRLGGTGRAFQWDRIAALAARRRVVVAGGLEAGNVGACIRAVRPFAVDVRSGVEATAGKSPKKMRAFVRAVREADAVLYGS